MSVDVFVDETSRGIQGNLALVLEGPSLDRLDNTTEALGAVAAGVQRILHPAYRAPLSLRLRFAHTVLEPSSATAEFHVKLRIPQDALYSGSSAVSALASTAVWAFDGLLEHPEVRRRAALD